MRLRRLELAILGVTIAFAVFMGGYFTGRNFSNVNVTAVSTERFIPPVENQIQSNPAHAENPGTIKTENESTTGESGSTGNSSPSANQNTQTVSDGRININTASAAQLTDLPGIGNTLAARIIDYRVKNGNFLRIEDIRNVSGIGERRFEAIKDLITVGD